MSIFLQALVWQFFDASKAIWRAWRNFLLFNLNYFSLPLLFRTLFSHWHKYRYSYGRFFELWKNIEVLIFNLMSRLIGAMMRIAYIVIGFVVEIIIILGGAIILIGWLLLPVLLGLGLIFGIYLLV